MAVRFNYENFLRSKLCYLIFDAERYIEKYGNNGNYGFGYVGSKNLIVKELFKVFPKADNFYDLFAGGCSVTHYALLSDKYKNFYANDLDPQPIRLFCDAVNGKFKNERRWISRDDFMLLKDSDDYVVFCWSFGNNCRTYLYSEDIEPYKKACHYAIVFNDFSLIEKLRGK